MSPISKEQAARYPTGWKGISDSIRFGRAEGRCECAGECGLHKTNPGPRRCAERHGQPATWAKGKVILTVAHLNGPGGPCVCDPPCARADHLKAICQRCHLRYDHQLHQANAKRTRARKKREAHAKAGQQELPQ